MKLSELRKLFDYSQHPIDGSAEVFIVSGATELTENYYHILDAKKIQSLTDQDDAAVYLYFDAEERKNEN